MNRKRSASIVLAALLATGLSACGASSDGSGGATGPARGGLPTVALIGDSVAGQEALPLAAALDASGIGFESLAEDGGGNVVGPFSGHSWAKLSARLAKAKAGIVVYQVTTYDWGSEKAQAAAYERLLDRVRGLGGELVFVTLPPIKVDDFYRPHMAELATTARAAEAVAAASAGRAIVLDAGAVWGPRYRRDREGIVDRSSDGIHLCPQGAARFTEWLLGELEAAHPGFEAAPPSAWANAGWSGSDDFHGC